ncbi:MAG: SUMF1/EgtB/PvdO family nonheme iron enzyme [Anaerolineae bacterium]|nr:SUMF1/EgtB/PvdO family nonheme iron enzyme [Anaerolineae bacterium]
MNTYGGGKPKNPLIQISPFVQLFFLIAVAAATVLGVFPEHYRFPMFVICISLFLWWYTNELIKPGMKAMVHPDKNLRSEKERRQIKLIRWFIPAGCIVILAFYYAPHDTEPTPSTSAIPPLVASTPTRNPTPVPTFTPNPTLSAMATNIATPDPSFKIQNRAVDGISQVFVPEGYFIAGDQYDDGIGYPDETPHLAYTDEFWIDQYLVTNKQFADCPEELCGEPDSFESHKREQYYGTATYANYPVIEVTWDQAVAYCDWRGGRLPTEAEWEKAAGWDPKTGDTLLYPWGDEPPNENLANFNGIDRDTTEVTNYPAGASPVGAYNMAGNVWQWVMDWYSDTYYSDNQDWVNPTGPLDGVKKVVRGGSWFTGSKQSSDIAWLRTANRGIRAPNEPGNEFGFRCVYGASQIP